MLLTAVPIMMIFGFLALAGSTTFMLFAAVFIMRRAGEYAFVRPLATTKLAIRPGDKRLTMRGAAALVLYEIVRGETLR